MKYFMAVIVKLSFILTLLFFGFLINAQNFESVGTLYQGNGISIELQYRMYNPCLGGKPSRFRYNVSGKYRVSGKYLNWKAEYYNCNQTITVMSQYVELDKLDEGIVEDFDYNFAGHKMELNYYDVTVSSYPVSSPSFTKPIPRSTLGKSISGNSQLYYGESTKLTVFGGGLGSGAVWKWYRGNCGSSPVGIGESVLLTPNEDAEYFVRAESPTEITDCISIQVKVDPRSKDPDLIDGKSLICKNQKDVPIRVIGGRLGKGAEWVWYHDNLSGTPIGKGSTLLVSPLKRTIYYVRAEGGINTTGYVSKEFDVIDEKFTNPDKIISPASVCSGNNLDLKISGGNLTASGEWVWYENRIDPSEIVGRGREVKVKPSKSVTYYVRGEGSCSTTETKTVAIEVGQLSQTPGYVNSSNDPKNRRRTVLSTSASELGKNGTLNWYRNKCGDGNRVGTGSSISVRVNKPTTFYVRTEGDCNKSTCSQVSIGPRRVEKYFFVNVGVMVSGGNDISNITETIETTKNYPVYSITFGKAAKTGWYFRGKFSAKNIVPIYTLDNNQPPLSSSNYFIFTGEKADNRWSLTTGITKQLSRGFFWTLGAGYGQRDLLWEMAQYSNLDNKYLSKSWADNLAGHYAGPEVETGLMFKLSMLNISFGASGIVYNTQMSGYNNKTYIDFQLGVGLIF